MGQYAPPYANKNRKKIERKLFKAKKAELRAKEKFEDAQEIVKLWQDRLNEATK